MLTFVNNRNPLINIIYLNYIVGYLYENTPHMSFLTYENLIISEKTKCFTVYHSWCLDIRQSSFMVTCSETE